MICTIIEWIKSNDSLITLLFSLVVMISTVVYAILTKKLVNETIIMRRIQTDPKIMIDISPTEHQAYLFNFLIENIGKSAAVNITFRLIDEPDFKNNKKISQYSFIQKGIKAMSPNEKFKTFLFSTINEDITFTDNQFTIIVEYEDLNKRKYSENIIFDLEYLNDLKYVNSDPIHIISDNIKKIEKSLTKISNKTN